jgi:hypothetical protein
MDYFQLIFFGVFALVAGSFLFGRLKYGSWTGAFLKGSIEQTYGEVLLSGGVASSQVLKVVELRDGNGEAFVGLVITAKAPLAASMTPYRLSKDQARELSGLLSLAAK